MAPADMAQIVMAVEKALRARTFELCPLKMKVSAEDVDTAVVAKQEEEEEEGEVCVAAE